VINELKLVRQEKNSLNNYLNEVNDLFANEKSSEVMKSKLFEACDGLLNKYSFMLFYSSDKGKTFYEYQFGEFCCSCGFKTVICPHKVTQNFQIIGLPENTTHIKLERPIVLMKLNKNKRKDTRSYQKTQAKIFESDDYYSKLLKEVEDRLKVSSASMYPHPEKDFNGGISSLRDLTDSQINFLMEDLYSRIICGDLYEQGKILTLKDHMYEMMEEKYSKNAENCTKDFIISIIRRSSQNKFFGMCIQ